MKPSLRSSRFFLFAYLIFFIKGQGQDDACWSCPLGDLFKSGFELFIDDATVPAVGASNPFYQIQLQARQIPRKVL